MHDEELILFVDSDGKPTGDTGPKLASHNAHTKLHLAFSCYIFRRKDSKFLLTQRSHSKKVWPGVWTNSVCGHPAPRESIGQAISRRTNFELGIEHLDDLRCIIPRYIYKTPPYNGIIEHEFCPIYVAFTDDEPRPNPEEVEAFKWVAWPEYRQMLASKPAIMSYWSKDQYTLIRPKEPFKHLS